MKVKSTEKKENNLVEIAVEAAADEFEAAVNSAYKKNKNSIAIPGFRKGKAPRKIIENMYGASVFYEDAIDILYPLAYEYAITDQDLNVVGNPVPVDVDISDDKIVTITFSTAVYPEVTMGEYKGVAAAKPAVKVLKKEIDEEIELIRKRNARIEATDKAAKSGDTANIDYEGFVDGVPFEGGKDEGHNLVLGSGQFIPGFEEQVIGLKAGETKDINVTFPENYAPELAGKEAVFKIKVNEVKESILPELDDEFAKDVSEFDTLEEYKNSVKETISERKKNDVETQFKDAVMEKIISDMECDVPAAMVDEHIDTMIRNYNYSLSAQGLNFEMYLQMMGMGMEDFRKNTYPSAEKQVKGELALEKIAELEEIQVTEDDVEAEYKKIADSYGMDIEAVKGSVAAQTLERQVKLDRAQALVFDSAVVEKKTTKKADKKDSEEGDASAE